MPASAASTQLTAIFQSRISPIAILGPGFQSLPPPRGTRKCLTNNGCIAFEVSARPWSQLPRNPDLKHGRSSASGAARVTRGGKMPRKASARQPEKSSPSRRRGLGRGGPSAGCTASVAHTRHIARSARTSRRGLAVLFCPRRGRSPAPSGKGGPQRAPVPKGGPGVGARKRAAGKTPTARLVRLHNFRRRREAEARAHVRVSVWWPKEPAAWRGVAQGRAGAPPGAHPGTALWPRLVPGARSIRAVWTTRGRRASLARSPALGGVVSQRPPQEAGAGAWNASTICLASSGDRVLSRGFGEQDSGVDIFPRSLASVAASLRFHVTTLEHACRTLESRSGDWHGAPRHWPSPLEASCGICGPRASRRTPSRAPGPAGPCVGVREVLWVRRAAVRQRAGGQALGGPILVPGAPIPCGSPGSTCEAQSASGGTTLPAGGLTALQGLLMRRTVTFRVLICGFESC